MQELQPYDVVISGAGMVGLSLALALLPSGLRVALLDPQPLTPEQEPWTCAAAGLAPPAGLRSAMTLPDFDPRVSALTPASASLLRELGVWQALEQLRLCHYGDMRVWDADGTGAIHFAAAEVRMPALGCIVENGLVTAALGAALAQRPACEWLQGESLLSFETRLDSAGRPEQQLRLASGTGLRCRLLIGADGAASRVRELAGFATRAWDYGQQALVATVKTAEPHQHTAWQRFMTSGPLAFLPLQLPGAEQQHYCSIVWSCVPELAAELLALDDSAFARRLELAFEARLGRIEMVGPRSSFPLRQQHASDYVQAALALVGDAAHTLHPLAGQGVNLGFADVRSLAGVLTRAVERGEDFAAEQVLSRYQRERKAANLGMMLAMEGFKRVFGSDSLSLRWARNAGLKAANALTPFKHEVMTRAMGLK
jgi:2-polyprenylphenol 6-hydroxylase